MRLTVHDLACRRSGRLIFEGLSFGLSLGDALAVTGRNGAGKSTLLAILAGRLQPEAGSVVIEDAGDRTLPECIHLVGHRDALKTGLTAEENLLFAARLLGRTVLSPLDALDRVGLSHAARLPVAYLSAGQRRRVALARLLVTHRPIWLLDEPTAALDVTSQGTLTGMMEEHLAQGGIIIAATHQALGLGSVQELRIERPNPMPLAGEGRDWVGGAPLGRPPLAESVRHPSPDEEEDP